MNEKDKQREERNEFHHLILERSRVADGCRRGMSWPRESVAISILTSRTWSAPSPVWKEARRCSIFSPFDYSYPHISLFFFSLTTINHSIINYSTMYTSGKMCNHFIDTLFYIIRRSFISGLYSYEYRCFSLLFAMTIKFESHFYSQHPYWEILYGIVSREVYMLFVMIENFYWT